jgi:protein required for attachment to host cells
MLNTWMLVCDAGRARIFSFEAADGDWETIEEIDNERGRARTSEIVTDRVGRVRQSGTGVKPGMEATTDPADTEETKFVHRLGQHLQHGFDRNRFGRLVLVAPPRFLGKLRKELSDPVSRSIAKSIDKDYSQLKEHELRDVLQPQLP